MQKPPNTVAYYYFTKQNTVMERGKYCYLNDFFNFVGGNNIKSSITQ